MRCGRSDSGPEKSGGGDGFEGRSRGSKLKDLVVIMRRFESKRMVRWTERFSCWAVAIAAILVGSLWASPILGQGCALCYNTASAAGSRGIAALRHGILILMVPPVIIFGVVCFFTVRGRNHYHDASETLPYS